MKCYHEDNECRSDCAIYQKEYKTCAFYIMPVMLGMVVNQLKELTEIVETLAYEMMANRADNSYLGEDSSTWEEAQRK